MNYFYLLFFLLFLFYPIFLYLHNLLIFLNRILLLCIRPWLMWRLNRTLLLFIDKSLKLFILHSLTLGLLLLLKYQLPFLGLFHNLQVLLLEINSGRKYLRILLIKFIAIHQHLIDISMKLTRMLIALLPQIILHGFQIDRLQYNVEILRYT